MNTQIRELAKQVDVTVLGTITGGRQYIFLEQDLAKFAELIVRECAKVLEIQGSNTGYEQYHYGASLIKEHFGVDV